MKSAQKNKLLHPLLLLYVLAVFLLVLTSININTYLAPKVVLGTKTEVDNSDEYWKSFVNKNPNYIPGLIEIGELDKAKQIDPNYITP
jgi:hypothetical protein